LNSIVIRRIGSTLAAIAGAVLQACASPPRLDAVPPTLTQQAAIPGIANARYWLDLDLAPFIQSAIDDNRRESEALARAGRPTDPMPPINLLAISGGGDAGAFAAGLLTGWSAQGTRPEFKVVTGISAGALIAPFAFLGPRFDDVIRRVATSIGKDDVFRSRGLLAGLASDGMADSEPLARLLAQYVTPDVLEAVAAEHAKGRALMIGTTDLDSGQPVTWNMGAIASSNAPGSLELFRKIMLASTSIPGVVSPVMIEVDVDGVRHQEMHVDGGVMAQVFTYPSRTLMEMKRATGIPFRREIHLYVIRNGQLRPQWLGTPRHTSSIGGRAFRALIQQQGISDLDRIYRTAQQDGAEFNLAYIGDDFTAPHDKDFDAAYMNRLFDYAYQLGATGYRWHKALPGDAMSERESTETIARGR